MAVVLGRICSWYSWIYTSIVKLYMCTYRNLGMCNGIVMGIEKVTDMKKAKKGN
jgi:hypothetical protein